MAGGAAFVRPKAPSQVHYDVPSAVSPLITRAEGRMTQMTKWRKDYRYRLKDTEKSDLSSMMGRQQMYSTLMYFGIGSVWWFSGLKNSPEFYDRFGVKGNLKQNLLGLQPHKLQFGITGRLMSSFAVTIPFSLLLAQAQDDYYQRALQYNTIFGGFCRYLEQQGEMVAHGNAVIPYIPAGSYLKKGEKKLRSSSTNSETLQTQTMQLSEPTKEAMRIISQRESDVQAAKNNINLSSNNNEVVGNSSDLVINLNESPAPSETSAQPPPLAGVIHPSVRALGGAPKHFVIQDPDIGARPIDDATEDFIAHVYGRL